MRAKHQLIGLALLLSAAGPAFSAVVCQGPTNKDGRWNLVCSEDDKSQTELKCNWKINVTTEGGGKGSVTAKATISRKQKNATVWSDERFDGKKITGATLVGGESCSP